MKEFYEAVVIDIKTLNIDNIVVSDHILDNKNGKRYIIGYNVAGKIVALRIKTPKNIYSYGVSKYTESSKWCMSFNLEAHDEWIEKYKKIWEAVEAQLFQCLTTEVVSSYYYQMMKMILYFKNKYLYFFIHF